MLEGGLKSRAPDWDVLKSAVRAGVVQALWRAPLLGLRLYCGGAVFDFVVEDAVVV